MRRSQCVIVVAERNVSLCIFIGANYPYTSEPYYKNVGLVGEVINFYNVEDDGLSGWVKGQDLKPNDGAGVIGISISPDEGYHCNYNIALTVYN